MKLLLAKIEQLEKQSAADKAAIAKLTERSIKSTPSEANHSERKPSILSTLTPANGVAEA